MELLKNSMNYILLAFVNQDIIKQSWEKQVRTNNYFQNILLNLGFEKYANFKTEDLNVESKVII